MEITLGFSPCPNDTFIFDALVNNKIDTKGINFKVVLDDVQTLNKWALASKLDVSKISYGVWPLLLNNYNLLNSGSALGKGVGPLLITKNELNKADVQHVTIAIPGENTTAHLLFSLAYPIAKKKQFMLFSQIEDAVLNGTVDAGVIIHENRFTYQQKGLKKIIDLGDYWEQTTGLPIPLGGIVAHKGIDVDLKNTIDGLIKESLEFAFANYPFITDYVKQHAQEMNEAVMKQHIDLYVNDFSLQLGVHGHAAVNKLLQVYNGANFDLTV